VRPIPKNRQEGNTHIKTVSTVFKKLTHVVCPKLHIPHISNMADFNARRVDWKTKKAIMVDIIANTGYIFGGAVRDWHLHEHGASLFYKAHVNNNKTNAQIDELYNDPAYMPEYAHRIIVPTDIDACIHSTRLQGLLDSLKEKRIQLTRIFSHDPVGYIPGIELNANEVEHMRFKVDVSPKIYKMLAGPLHQELAPIIEKFAKELENTIQNSLKTFTMDIMVVKVPVKEEQPIAPFGNLDFECNGLIASKNGIGLSKHLCKSFDPMHYDRERKRIMDDILLKKAIIVKNPPGERNINVRTQKMLRKGWTISGFKSVDYIESASDDEDLGHCLVCHEDFDGQVSHYKMGCCNGRFHLRCLIQAMTVGVSAMVQTKECIMCKRHLWDPQTDYHILHAIARAHE